MQHEDVKQYLKDLQTKFCAVPTDKASNNFSFTCKMFYVAKLLDEIGLSVTQSDTHKLVKTT